MLYHNSLCVDKLIRLQKRFINSKNLTTANISISNDLKILNDQDIEHLNNLPFFKDSNILKKSISNNKRYTKQQQEYLQQKLSNISDVFGIDPIDPPYINHKWKPNMLTPYQTILANPNGHNRLSVTKIITRSWCELRYAYDLSSTLEKLPTRYVKKGVKFHKSLEDNLYKPNGELEAFISFQNIRGFRKTLWFNWFDTLKKLIGLYSSAGECREILCHAYINSDLDDPQDGNFVEDVNKFKNDNNLALISGIIDHLKWKKKTDLKNDDNYPRSSCNSFDLFDDIFKNSDISNDLSKIISKLNEEIPKRTKDWAIQVSDIKTRHTFNVPKQTSVIKTTKLQIMYYKKFLETLAIDPILTYEKLILNATKRQINVDEPIDPVTIMAFIVDSPYLIPDMQRMRDGKPIGFVPFDEYDYTMIDYDATALSSQIINGDIREKLGEFFTAWKKPVTLRYFAARLAQTYHLIGSSLSDKLLVEYYFSGNNFHNINFDYDNRKLIEHNIDSSNFLFGKRQIEPIKQNAKNFLTYCKHCEYETVCSWKHKGEKFSEGLYNDLVEVCKD